MLQRCAAKQFKKELEHRLSVSNSGKEDCGESGDSLNGADMAEEQNIEGK